MPAETIAVIIPTFNRGAAILSTLASVARQSYGAVRTIVVVDGSSDETMPVLQRYRDSLPAASRERLDIRFQENRGVSAARNNGIRVCDARFIALLDDDDDWHPEKLTRQMQAMRGLTKCEHLLCTTDFYNITPDEASECIRCAACVDIAGQIRVGRFPPPSSWLFSRATFEAAGGFDESLHAGEDVDFVTNLRRMGATIHNLDDALTYYRDKPGKIYRDQHGGAVTTLLRHHDWWAEVLSANDYQTIMQWYRRILPAEMYRDAMQRLQYGSARVDIMLGARPDISKSGWADN